MPKAMSHCRRKRLLHQPFWHSAYRPKTKAAACVRYAGTQAGDSAVRSTSSPDRATRSALQKANMLKPRLLVNTTTRLEGQGARSASLAWRECDSQGSAAPHSIAACALHRAVARPCQHRICGRETGLVGRRSAADWLRERAYGAARPQENLKGANS